MPFPFSMLPMYAPKPPLGPVTAIPPETVFAFVTQEQGNKAVRIAADAYDPSFDSFFLGQGVAELQIEAPFGTVRVSYSPLGLKHAVLPAWSVDAERYVRDGIRAVTASVPEQTGLDLASAGWSLRTPMVRWLSPVFKDAEDLEASLKKTRRKALRKNLRKSEPLRVVVESLTDENLPLFTKAYRDSIPKKAGGFEIFLLKLWEQKGVPAGLNAVFFYDPAGTRVLGVSVINTWGAQGDTGKDPRKYCACTVAGFSEEGKTYEIGYRDFLVEMEMARVFGDPVYSAGGDFNFWGADITTGLMQNKATVGFYPFPEGKPEWFTVLQPEEIVERSGDDACAFFALTAAGAAVARAGFDPRRAFADQELDPSRLWTLVCWSTGPKTFSSPDGIPVSLQPLR